MSPFLLKEGITGSCCNGKRHGFGSPIIGERIISEGKEFKLELEPESEPGLGIVTWEVLLIRMINKTYYENIKHNKVVNFTLNLLMKYVNFTWSWS